jgi:hypothetical protein
MPLAYLPAAAVCYHSSLCSRSLSSPRDFAKPSSSKGLPPASPRGSTANSIDGDPEWTHVQVSPTPTVVDWMKPSTDPQQKFGTLYQSVKLISTFKKSFLFGGLRLNYSPPGGRGRGLHLSFLPISNFCGPPLTPFFLDEVWQNDEVQLIRPF